MYKSVMKYLLIDRCVLRLELALGQVDMYSLHFEVVEANITKLNDIVTI